MDYKVIKDTREKDGWIFEPSDLNKCTGMEIGTLKTGDYTLRGYENLLCIERKASVSEIATNLGKKKKTFEREMERMMDFRLSFIILEFDLKDVLMFPEGTNIPQRARSKIKITSKYLLRTLTEFQFKYNSKILFCGNKENAQAMAVSIFKRVIEMF
jgi:hypothetical protein